jgi:hypothetical protein
MILMLIKSVSTAYMLHTGCRQRMSHTHTHTHAHTHTHTHTHRIRCPMHEQVVRTAAKSNRSASFTGERRRRGPAAEFDFRCFFLVVCSAFVSDDVIFPHKACQSLALA